MADTFTQAERSRIMALVKSKDTTPELVVRRLVHALGFRLTEYPRIATDPTNAEASAGPTTPQ